MRQLTFVLLTLICCGPSMTPSQHVRFDNRPAAGMPIEARRAFHGFGRRSISWRELVGGKIGGFTVRYYDKTVWKSEESVSSFLRNLFDEKESVNVWSNEMSSRPLGVPDLECRVNFTPEEYRRTAANQKTFAGKGRLLVWDDLGCYLDCGGAWHFLDGLKQKGETTTEN